MSLVSDPGIRREAAAFTRNCESFKIRAIKPMALVAFFRFIRQQTVIVDRQFLKSMIPHHAGAILMCNEAPLEDAEIKKLCQTINSSQQSEIDQMKAILKRLEGS